MSLATDGDDQAARLDQFRIAHPDVPILLLGDCPRAWVGDQKVEHPTLRGLLDGLEEILRLGARNSCTGAAQ
jgi:hypothetical protein